MIGALWRFPRMSRDELAAWRDARLRRLVAHAYEQVPYYRQHFDRHGVRPEHVRGAADLHRIPVTTKRDLMSQPAAEVMARNIRTRLMVGMRTSGSSGERFVVRRTLREQYVLHTARLRAYRSYGLGAGDRVARIGVRRQGGLFNRTVFGRPIGDLGLNRQTLVDTFLPPDAIAAELARLRPDVLGGFAGVLARVAESVLAAERRDIRPRIVLTGSEVLTPAMRRTITEAFGARVFNVYGSTECNLLAWECAHSDELHTCDDGAIVEVLRDGRPAAPGESGEVVATNLHAWAMPLIRYHQGDVVTRGSGTCACGLPFATIRDIQGRMIDFFPLPDGRLVHPYEVVARFRATGWIRQYQLVQERMDRLVLRVVASSELPAGPSAEQVGSVAASIAALLGPSVEIAVDVVPEIALEASGKFRVARSLVRSAYDDTSLPTGAPAAMAGAH